MSNDIQTKDALVDREIRANQQSDTLERECLLLEDRIRDARRLLKERKTEATQP